MRIKNSADFGQVIRKARISQNLRQIDVAAFSNCGERFIVDIEKGKPTCELDKALHVAHMLGISIVAAFPGESEHPIERVEEQ